MKIEEHKLSYSKIFDVVNKNGVLHIKNNLYSLSALRKECCLQNKIYGKPLVRNNKALPKPKFYTTTKEMEGYITIKKNW